MDVLFRSLLLAQLLGSASESDEEGEPESAHQGPAIPSMPVPVTMPEPDLGGTVPQMPVPEVGSGSAYPIPGSSAASAPPSGGAQAPSTNSTAPPRPLTPDKSDVARSTLAWRLFTAPLYSRLAKVLYDSDDSLPEPTSGNVGYLKLDDYGARNTVDCMCALTRFLQDNKWEAQSVDKFVETLNSQPHWPDKLRNEPHEKHVAYAWMLMNGLLAVIGLKPYLEPSSPPTFAGIVEKIFPPVPDGTAKPEIFSFTARELIEEDFIIQPTTNMLDHLKLVGSAVNVFVLASEQASMLIGYDKNRAARAIGMANLGNEILQSYGALVEGEFHENYRLPISLGMFKIDPDRPRRGQFEDLTVVTGVIRLFRNSSEQDHQPHLLASRVLIIEEALRRRRRWYSRLRRDIHKRKKTEPWMFWGAVLAVFFGVCTVIQTVTSVWSLAVSLS
ncbi:hypothetical protein C8Q79DRAFT_1003946 [Trametes meyenii]|nr:hypothetical protein C8Q79DRAFT_1003946 [Trametes meyenii]